MDRRELASELMRLGNEAYGVYIDASDLKHCGVVPTQTATIKNPYPRGAHVGEILSVIAEQLELDEKEGVSYNDIREN